MLNRKLIYNFWFRLLVIGLTPVALILYFGSSMNNDDWVIALAILITLFPILIIAIVYIVIYAQKCIATWRAHFFKQPIKESVLFLRPFTKDGRIIKHSQVPEWTSTHSVMMLWRYALKSIFPDKSIEDLIASGIRDRIGPLIALGNPKDFLPRLGAYRYYCMDTEWMKMISGWAPQSRAVILLIGDTCGYDLELDFLRNHVDPQKVFIIVEDEPSMPQWEHLSEKTLKAIDPSLNHQTATSWWSSQVEQIWENQCQHFAAHQWALPKRFPGKMAVIGYNMYDQPKVLTPPDSTHQLIAPTIAQALHLIQNASLTATMVIRETPDEDNEMDASSEPTNLLGSQDDDTRNNLTPEPEDHTETYWEWIRRVRDKPFKSGLAGSLLIYLTVVAAILLAFTNGQGYRSSFPSRNSNNIPYFNLVPGVLLWSVILFLFVGLLFHSFENRLKPHQRLRLFVWLTLWAITLLITIPALIWVVENIKP